VVCFAVRVVECVAVRVAVCIALCVALPTHSLDYDVMWFAMRCCASGTLLSRVLDATCVAVRVAVCIAVCVAVTELWCHVVQCGATCCDEVQCCSACYSVCCSVYCSVFRSV